MRSKLQKVYVSFDEMERGFNRVRKELGEMGLLYEGWPLDDVECYHETFTVDAVFGAFTGVMGFYDFGDRNIHIPAVYPAALFSRWYGDRKILDVIRHEFGHALADRYRKYFRSSEFKSAFGANYGETKVFDGGDWSREFVSEYATTNTQEDFAETFMLFMKHKGKLPASFRGNRAITRKWRLVEKIVKGIASSSRSGIASCCRN